MLFGDILLAGFSVLGCIDYLEVGLFISILGFVFGRSLDDSVMLK